MFELAAAYGKRGMEAYAELQTAEFASEAKGYTATKHQREVCSLSEVCLLSNLCVSYDARCMFPPWGCMKDLLVQYEVKDLRSTQSRGRHVLREYSPL
jgi:hypothetical protein